MAIRDDPVVVCLNSIVTAKAENNLQIFDKKRKQFSVGPRVDEYRLSGKLFQFSWVSSFFAFFTDRCECPSSYVLFVEVFLEHVKYPPLTTGVERTICRYNSAKALVGDIYRWAYSQLKVIRLILS